MTSANLSNLPLKILFVAMMAVLLSSSAHAQYTPPPMFEEMGTNSVRPNPPSGYIVPQTQSPITPQAQPPAPGTQQPPVIRPRVSIDPDKNPAPAVTPYVPRMAPIVEPKKPERKISRTPAPAVVPPKKPVAPAPVAAVPAAPATPTVTPAPEPTTPVPTPIPTRIPAEEPPIAPKPDSGMTEPVYTPQPVYSPVVKPAEDAKPQPVPVPRAPGAPMPAAKVTSPGVVKGPKTMPAVPTTNVDQVETFDDSALQNEPTIMERHLKATKKKADAEKKEATLTPVLPAAKPKAEEQTKAVQDVPDMPSDPAPTIAFDDAKPAVLKKILPYQAGQIDLPKEDLAAIAAGVQTELKAKPDWRIQIRSFATPQGEGLSSDRRIALSRALSIRTALVANGIDASMIDLRADGLQTDESQTGDRVDLYLYNPSEPVQTP